MCVDLDASSAIDGGAWTTQQRADAIKKAQMADAGPLAGGVVKSGPMKGGSSVVIQDECATAFRDRLELASCSTGPLVLHYYSFALLETDAEMRDCLQSRGNWSALSRDSDEYHRAHARYEIEKAEKQAQRLQQQLGQ